MFDRQVILARKHRHITDSPLRKQDAYETRKFNCFYVR